MALNQRFRRIVSFTFLKKGDIIWVQNKTEDVKMNTDKIYAESIANEYTVKESRKVVQLKKLDRKAKLPANIFTYTFGIIASLVFGVGMCLCMKVIGSGSDTSMIIGIVVGVLGIIMAGINYPIYKKMLIKGKNKYAADIVALAKEISDEE